MLHTVVALRIQSKGYNRSKTTAMASESMNWPSDRPARHIAASWAVFQQSHLRVVSAVTYSQMRAVLFMRSAAAIPPFTRWPSLQYRNHVMVRSWRGSRIVRFGCS